VFSGKAAGKMQLETKKPGLKNPGFFVSTVVGEMTE